MNWSNFSITQSSIKGAVYFPLDFLLDFFLSGNTMRKFVGN